MFWYYVCHASRISYCFCNVHPSHSNNYFSKVKDVSEGQISAKLKIWTQIIVQHKSLRPGAWDAQNDVVGCDIKTRVFFL